MSMLGLIYWARATDAAIFVATSAAFMPLVWTGMLMAANPYAELWHA